MRVNANTNFYKDQLHCALLSFATYRSNFHHKKLKRRSPKLLMIDRAPIKPRACVQNI